MGLFRESGWPGTNEKPPTTEGTGEKEGEKGRKENLTYYVCSHMLVLCISGGNTKNILWRRGKPLYKTGDGAGKMASG